MRDCHAESSLVIALDQTDVVVELVRCGSESGETLRSAAEIEATRYAQHDEIGKYAVTLHTNRWRGKVRRMDACNRRSIHGETECIHHRGAEQIRAAHGVRL